MPVTLVTGNQAVPISPGILEGVPPLPRGGRGGLLLLVLLFSLFPLPAQAAVPKRIVSLAPSLTETLFAVGAGGQVVAVTEYCNFPPAVSRVPRIGGLQDGSVDLERIVALRPDLVVTLAVGQGGTVAALRRLGVRVEVVPAETVDDALRAIRRLGALTGHRAEAARLEADLARRIRAVREKVAAVPPERRPRVFFQLWDEPLMTATGDTLAGQLVEMAGGVNVFADLAGRYPQVSPEAVLARDPQVILAPAHHAGAVNPDRLARRPGWDRIDAVRHGRVFVLDGDLVSRPGPRMAEALERVARSLHPERFGAGAP
jgi:iron complex transport system substrate-binding protein